MFFQCVQNTVAYVLLVIVIFVLVYILIISEVAVTSPGTSCFMPIETHSAGVTFKYKVFISDNIYADTDILSDFICDKIGLQINRSGSTIFHNVHVCPSRNLDG